MKLFFQPYRITFIAVALLILGACERGADNQTTVSAPAQIQVPEELINVAVEDIPEENPQFNIGNTQYLFDVSTHTAEELEALLYRAEEIREAHAEGYDDLEIVLILHGPDINFFRQENYIKHKPIVDLAAKLDAYDIIDMKICETTMSNMGVARSEVPAFIESVPYAPAEIRRLGEEGYINL